MRSVLFTIGPFTVYGYGLMIAVGVLAGYFCTAFRSKKMGISADQAFGLVVWCVLSGLLFAKLLFFITEWKTLIEDPRQFLYSLTDGFVIYGGILGGLLGALVYCRRENLSFPACTDLALPSVALGQGFGRIGCLLAGCCYGKETDCVLSITFHNSDYAPSSVPLIPTQIYSSILDFLHFFILLAISGKKKRDGEVTAWYLILYSAGRFVMEFFRGDLYRGNVGILSTSQFIAVFTFLAGVFVLGLGSRRGAR